jgi:hypothetical protein
VAGDDCPDGEVGFAMLAGTSLEDVFATVDEDFITTGEDGTWSGELLVWDTQFLLEDDSEVDVVPRPSAGLPPDQGDRFPVEWIG